MSRFYVSYVKILNPMVFLASRSGYCDLEGFQVDLSAEINTGTVYVFLDRRIIRKYFFQNPLLAVGMKI